MAIINCKDCGRVCAASHSELCAACWRRTRQAEVKVTEYLDAHPQSILEEIHKGTGVERHLIMRMIRDGLIAAGAVKYPVQAEPERGQRSSRMYPRSVLFGQG